MNHIIRQLIICSATVAVGYGQTYGADPASLGTVEILGKEYYVYKARKGDSLFGIARTYGWDDSVLSELNPSAQGSLKKGMLIYYPTGKEAVSKPASEGHAPRVDDTSGLRHEVRRGETIYAISKMYGVPVEKLYSLNPQSRNGIKAGESLIIRGAESVGADNSEHSVFYSVKPGDTLYSLAQKYGVTVAAIMQSNPGVDDSNFRSGSTVKIPRRGTGVVTTTRTIELSNVDSINMHRVQKSETWSSIASQTGVSEEVLRQANPDVSELKSKDFIAVPHVEVTTTSQEVVTRDPRETSPAGLSEIYHDVHGIVSPDSALSYTVKVAVVADNVSTKKDKEFIRGFLTGIDSRKNDGLKIDFKVIDGSQDSGTVIESLKEFEPTLVFTTSDNNLPDYLNIYAADTETPVVNTFDVKSGAYADNPYIIQLLTPPSLFNDNVAHYVNGRYGDRTIVFVGEEDANDQLAESLYTVWDSSKIKNILSIDGVIPEMFANDGRYVIYFYGTRKADVSQFLSNVAKVKEELPLADIVALGRPNLIVFEDGMIDDFRKASLSIPSRFYIEKDSREYKDFCQRYKALFDRTPAKSLPLYAAVGFDSANYFMTSLASARGDFNKLPPSAGTVQSDFQLYRPSNWSGFLNPPVYMIDYTSYGGTTKNIVSYSE